MIYDPETALRMYQALNKGLDMLLDEFTHWKDKEKNLLAIDVEIDILSFSRLQQVKVCREMLDLQHNVERLTTVIHSIYLEFKDKNVKDPTKR